MRKGNWIAGVVVVTSFMALGAANPEARGWPEQGRGRGQPQKPDKPASKAEKKDNKDNKAAPHDEGGAVAVDRDGHVRVIHEYARGGSLPPGLAKRRALPPGLRDQMHERGALPPGLQKRLVVVPASLSKRLPPVPTYYRRYFAGEDLLVIDTRSNFIVLILRDVWR